nr:hypothetical protein [Tanacetum cinerariifolium]
MLVPQQAADDVADDVTVDIVADADAEPIPPSPTPTTTSPPPPQEDKIAQAIEITKLKQRVRMLEKKNKLKVSGLKKLRKDVILEEVDAAKNAKVAKDADVQGRLEEVGKGFSRVDTPLFKGMLVPQQAADDVADDVTVDIVADADAEPIPPSPTPTTTSPPPPQEDKIAQAIEITKLKQRVRMLEKKNKLKVSGLKKLRKEVDAAKNAEVAKDADVQGRLEESQAYHIDLEHANKVLSMHDDKLEPAELKEEPQTEAQARKNMMVYLKNMAGFKMDFFRGMSYNNIRLIFEKYFNSNVAFLEKSEKELEEEASKALKRKNESFEQQAVKKQKLDEEAEELKKHLQIVPNKDDVYTEATPLALKVPVVDYQIHTENNKPYYKIIRADGTHQLFLSFISL